MSFLDTLFGKRQLDRLKQKTFPFVCDEGVYHIVIDIFKHRLEVFKNLFPILGSFHMAKAALWVAGKFLKRSGIEDAVIEPQIFGIKFLQQV